MGYVKFDMHCHTAEGSVDAKVGIDDYIKILKSKGFNGMVVTDHDSYDGYDAYLSYGKKYDDFVVLRGIEYDSLEFGHFIVILPQNKGPWPICLLQKPERQAYFFTFAIYILFFKKINISSLFTFVISCHPFHHINIKLPNSNLLYKFIICS